MTGQRGPAALNAREVDDFTLTVQLVGPDLRSALVAVADALADAEAAIGPSCTGSGGKAAGKPGSKPPAGSTRAAKLCRQLVYDSENMAARVAKLYRAMDPREVAATKEWRAQVRAMRARERDEIGTALRRAVAVDGKAAAPVERSRGVGRPRSLEPEQEAWVIALCAKGLSQRAVAERTGISQTTVYRLVTRDTRVTPE